LIKSCFHKKHAVWSQHIGKLIDDFFDNNQEQQEIMERNLILSEGHLSNKSLESLRRQNQKKKKKYISCSHYDEIK